MHVATRQHLRHERGISLSGLIFMLAIVAMVAVVVMKIFPTYIEFRSIKDGIKTAKAGTTVREMQIMFDKSAEINGIEAISGRDLIISKDNGETEISFSYEKRIGLVGNVSLVIDYAGTTAVGGVVAKKPAE